MRYFIFNCSVLIFLFLANSVMAQNTVLSGLVVSSDEKPISYVNIGIKNKKLGAVTNQNGLFKIKIPDSLKNEMLIFSCVGFESITLKISSLLLEKKIRIYLEKRIIAIPEITFKDRKIKPYQVGIKGRTPLIYAPSKSYNNNDIIEQARIFKINEPVKILNANIFLSYANTDSIKLRLNFYNLLNDFPNERLIHKSIIKTFISKEGWLTFDLNKDDIYINENFAVSFEFLPEMKENLKIPTMVYGAKLGASNSFIRLGSQAKWNKNELGGASIFLTVE